MLNGDVLVGGVSLMGVLRAWQEVSRLKVLK